jgi:hypothetical protein
MEDGGRLFYTSAQSVSFRLSFSNPEGNIFSGELLGGVTKPVRMD